MRKTSKLRLSPEELRVESFATAAREMGGAGTVRANEIGTRFFECYSGFEPTCDAAVYTCPECASPPYTDFTCGPPIDPIDP
jgi:hypothetical protein